MIPLISCICVTADRREFLASALESYRSQDWPRKELVVVDDGKDAIEDLLQGIPNCKYIYVATKQRIGVKRNLACEAAQGEIIVHWDDDDWSAPERISDQVKRLINSGKAVSGYHSLLFWDGECAFRYKGAPDYSLGSALCYRKEFWWQHAFIPEDHRRWEDNVFVQDARNAQQIVSVDGAAMMVARIHPGNTCPKKPLENQRQWERVAQSEIPEAFFRAIAASFHISKLQDGIPATHAGMAPQASAPAGLAGGAAPNFEAIGLEAHKFSRIEICSLFHVPPHLLGGQG